MPDLLSIDRLSAGYGEAVVLSEISFSVPEGQAVALLGRNGMGKTTLVNSIVGVTRYRGGSIGLAGRDITPLRPDQRAHAGVGWVPQERNIFKSLTVEENLSAVARPGPWTVARAYEMFPRLQERRANLGNQLSGGEQQMLSIGRALMTHPELIILDEATEGLAPLIVADIWRVIGEIRASGIATLIVDRDYRRVLARSDRAIVLQKGQVVLEGGSEAVAANPALAGFLGV